MTTNNNQYYSGIKLFLEKIGKKFTIEDFKSIVKMNYDDDTTDAANKKIEKLLHKITNSKNKIYMKINIVKKLVMKIVKNDNVFIPEPLIKKLDTLYNIHNTRNAKHFLNKLATDILHANVMFANDLSGQITDYIVKKYPSNGSQTMDTSNINININNSSTEESKGNDESHNIIDDQFNGFYFEENQESKESDQNIHIFNQEHNTDDFLTAYNNKETPSTAMMDVSPYIYEKNQCQLTMSQIRNKNQQLSLKIQSNNYKLQCLQNRCDFLDNTIKSNSQNNNYNYSY